MCAYWTCYPYDLVLDEFKSLFVKAVIEYLKKQFKFNKKQLYLEKEKDLDLHLNHLNQKVCRVRVDYVVCESSRFLFFREMTESRFEEEWLNDYTLFIRILYSILLEKLGRWKGNSISSRSEIRIPSLNKEIEMFDHLLSWALFVITLT